MAKPSSRSQYLFVTVSRRRSIIFAKQFRSLSHYGFWMFPRNFMFAFPYKVHNCNASFSHKLIQCALLGVYFKTFLASFTFEGLLSLMNSFNVLFNFCIFEKPPSQIPHLKKFNVPFLLAFFLEKLASQRPHLKGSHELIHCGILSVVLLKSYSHNAYILKAPFPHELIQCGFSSCHFVKKHS
jgi:hypothetical protein